MSAARQEFGKLSPFEVAVLTLSADSPQLPAYGYDQLTVRITNNNVHINVPRSMIHTEKESIVFGKQTLLVGCLLARAYHARRGNIDVSAVQYALDQYARKVIRTRNEGTDFFLGEFDILTQIKDLTWHLHEFAEFPGIDDSEDWVPQLANSCLTAIRSLERRGWIVDPPKLRGAANIALIVLLGSVPLDFTYRTDAGREVVQQVKYDAPTWEFTYENMKEGRHWHFNLKIAEFVDQAITFLAKRHLHYFDEQDPPGSNSSSSKSERAE